ncbi:hypothetical protein FRC10_002904 [Ceratobasidium sp. 414]|nr:hypothetical protein FRC10_002904 [Ceratobasidium sp. 414]
MSKAQFDKAVEIVQGMPRDGPVQPTQDDKLKFYMYFKQGTIGDVDTARPGLLDFVGKAKWDAWKGVEGTSKEDAQKKYVDRLLEVLEKDGSEDAKNVQDRCADNEAAFGLRSTRFSSWHCSILWQAGQMVSGLRLASRADKVPCSAEMFHWGIESWTDEFKNRSAGARSSLFGTRPTTHTASSRCISSAVIQGLTRATGPAPGAEFVVSVMIEAAWVDKPPVLAAAKVPGLALHVLRDKRPTPRNPPRPTDTDRASARLARPIPWLYPLATRHFSSGAPAPRNTLCAACATSAAMSTLHAVPWFNPNRNCPLTLVEQTLQLSMSLCGKLLSIVLFKLSITLIHTYIDSAPAQPIDTPLSFFPSLSMPAARKTRSGRNAPPPPSKRVRTKGGCLTCRVRRKKCDESRDHNGGCGDCARLHIECLGYSTKRPDWLKGPQVDDIKRKIKHFLADNNAKSSSRTQSDAFLFLRTSRTLPAPPRQRSDTDESDSESDAGLKPVVSSSYAYSSPPDLYLGKSNMRGTHAMTDTLADLMPPIADWPQPDPLVPHIAWNPLLDFYSDHFASPISDDAEGSIYNLDNSMPGLVDSPVNMLSFDYGYPLPSLDDVPVQVTVGSYQQYDPQRESLFAPFFKVLELCNAGSLADALAEALQGDPEGVQAVFDGLTASQQGQLLERGQAALHGLRKAGFNKLESRAFACLWLMAGSLSRGDFTLWGDCLDLVLGWVNDVCSAPFSFYSLTTTQQLVLKRAIWSDIVAGATTKRQPLRIELYRKVLAPAQPEFMDSNKTALAIAETVALAAHPDQLPRASKNLDRLREDLPLPGDHLSSKAAIHAAGGRLYLEIVAHRGAAHPAVQEAVRTVCTLASRVDQQRDVAFWIFLAGCHTVDADQWASCDSMMAGIALGGEGEVAVSVAHDVMKEVHAARQLQRAQQDMWRVQMNEHGALLIDVRFVMAPCNLDQYVITSSLPENMDEVNTGLAPVKMTNEEQEPVPPGQMSVISEKERAQHLLSVHR